MALWALCVALMLSIMPMNALAAEAAETALVGTKLTTSHAGKVLSGDYYVEPGVTLELRGSTGTSGLKVADGQTLTIHIPEGSPSLITLTRKTLSRWFFARWATTRE